MLRTAILSLILLSPVAAVNADDSAQKSMYQGALKDRVDALATVQPGLGVIMHEMGYRFSAMYWAANGGNWGLAQYELKELREAMEIAMTTRPQRAAMLKAYGQKHLSLLDEAVAEKRVEQFNHRFSTALHGCNACHQALGFGYVRYRLPETSSQEFLDFGYKSEPGYREEKENR